jgi:hypothetical protein
MSCSGVKIFSRGRNKDIKDNQDKKSLRIILIILDILVSEFLIRDDGAGYETACGHAAESWNQTKLGDAQRPVRKPPFPGETGGEKSGTVEITLDL